MVARARFVATYAVFWLLYFEVLRAAFLLYEWRNTALLTSSEIAGSFLVGIKLDVSAAAVLTMLPLCLVARSGFIPERVITRALAIYTAACIAIIALLSSVDLELFRVWGHHVDGVSLRYLASPAEALASAGASPILFLAGAIFFATILIFSVFALGVVPYARRIGPISQARSALFVLILLPVLVAAERGGIDRRVHLTTSSVYFSRAIFADQAAVNPLWNFVASVFYLTGEGSVYAIENPASAKAIVDSLMSPDRQRADSNDIRLLRTRPDRIVLILWESLTAKIIEPLGGMRGITPGFSRLARDGVLFSGMYASGQRTTNGLVAALSGLPGDPISNPLNSSERSAALPRLSADLSAAGYRTIFYYGAPLAFDNRQRYMFRSHFGVVVQKGDFDQRFLTSAWGAHDQFVLARLADVIDTSSAPVFAMTLTLSSHEPFEVPPPVLIPGSSAEQKFLNAQAYSDRAVETFVNRLRSRPGWDRTLVIIVADHGSPYPAIGSPSGAAPGQFRIPMLWLGGALAAHDTVIPRIGAQYDIPATLLSALGFSTKKYPFSKDLLGARSNEFAFYSFQDGFGFVDDSVSYVFDNTTKSVVYQTGSLHPGAVTAGRAFQQSVMADYRMLARPAELRTR